MFQEKFLAYAPTSDKGTALFLFDKLVQRYNEHHRFYHNLSHIETGLKTYAELFTEPLSQVDFFTWAYHDVVYESKQDNNEQRSADYFLWHSDKLELDVKTTDLVIAGILSTKISEEPIGVVNDIDLSALGAPPEVYAQNIANIRKEYDWVGDPVWQAGRTAVLRQLLKRPTLYVTQPFFDRFTDQAIINMTNELESLNG